MSKMVPNIYNNRCIWYTIGVVSQQRNQTLISPKIFRENHIRSKINKNAKNAWWVKQQIVPAYGEIRNWNFCHRMKRDNPKILQVPIETINRKVQEEYKTPVTTIQRNPRLFPHFIFKRCLRKETWITIFFRVITYFVSKDDDEILQRRHKQKVSINDNKR